MTINQDELMNLYNGNKNNLDDPSDKYAQGYNDALLDVLNLVGIKPEGAKYYD